MNKPMPKIKLASILLVCFFLSGCAAKEKLDWFDQKVGEAIQNFQTEQSEKVINIMKEPEPANPKDLTDEQKDAIDLWLKENSFNRYGDPSDTIYAGGSPLFNKQTGENIERFEYILERQPDILQKIK